MAPSPPPPHPDAVPRVWTAAQQPRALGGVTRPLWRHLLSQFVSPKQQVAGRGKAWASPPRSSPLWGWG